MAYEKQTWKTGDVVTAAKLNNMENGIANSGVFIVEISATDITADIGTPNKTRAQILEAFQNGMACYADVVDNLIPISCALTTTVTFSGLAVTADGDAVYALLVEISANGGAVMNHSAEPLIEL